MKIFHLCKQEEKMLYPKPTKRKKKKKHGKSLLQNKESRRRVESVISAQEREIIIGSRCWRSTTSSAVPTDTYQKNTD